MPILPEELRNGIIDTYVLSGYNESTGEKQETVDKLYFVKTISGLQEHTLKFLR